MLWYWRKKKYNNLKPNQDTAQGVHQAEEHQKQPGKSHEDECWIIIAIVITHWVSRALLRSLCTFNPYLCKPQSWKYDKRPTPEKLIFWDSCLQFQAASQGHHPHLMASPSDCNFSPHCAFVIPIAHPANRLSLRGTSRPVESEFAVDQDPPKWFSAWWILTGYHPSPFQKTDASLNFILRRLNIKCLKFKKESKRW